MKKTKNFIRAIQAFMDSARGKTVLNYLYSWGAAVVILGTLFKLTHIAGANLMLFVGMGTEVLVFFFSAFERPYEVAEEEKREEMAEEALAKGQAVIINGPIMAGGCGPVMNTGSLVQPQEIMATETAQQANGIQPDIQAQDGKQYIGGTQFIGGGMPVVGNMQEMETLGRNLTGMNALYEVQLRSAGGQLDSIDKVNEQTKKMADQVEELNNLYARMIEAMTTNMNRPQI